MEHELSANSPSFGEADWAGPAETCAKALWEEAQREKREGSVLHQDQWEAGCLYLLTAAPP